MRKIIVSTLTALAAVSFTSFAITPQEVMQQTVAKIKGAKGIAGNFRASGDQGSASGAFKFDGTRTYIESGQFGKQWFDGKTLWTLNPNTKEVTVSTPEPADVADANPLMYLNGYNSTYRLFFSKRKEAGKYLVLLNPRNKNADIKAIEVAINTKTLLPERFIVRTNDDQRSTVYVTNLNLNGKLPAGTFTFPAAKYKDYEIVDIR